MPFTASTSTAGSGSAARCDTLSVNLSPMEPPTTSAVAFTVMNCVAAFAVPWIPLASILIFASLRVTPCVAEGAFLFTTWLSSSSVNTSETGVALLSRANVFTASARPSTTPDAKTRAGAVAAPTLGPHLAGPSAGRASGRAFRDRDLTSRGHGDGAARVRGHLEGALVHLIGRLRPARGELLDEREEAGAADDGDRARCPHLVARVGCLELLHRRPRSAERLLDGHLDAVCGHAIQSD